MKNTIIAAILLLSANTAAIAAHYPANLEGKYDCTGTETDNKSHFKGVVTIKKTGQTYTMSSTFDDGTSYTGIGLYDQAKHVFSNAAIDPKKPDELAISISDVNQDKSLKSTFTYANSTAIGYSNCIKQKDQA
jgi:hypothetical protein